MRSVFVAFVITSSLMTAATASTGVLVDGERYFDHHFALGLVTTLFACLGHTVVFTYFMATSKMIRLAVEDAGLDGRLFDQSRRQKLRAYRAVMSAIIMILAAALAGGWVTYRPERSSLHLVLALASVAAQLGAWWVEFHAITANGALMDEVFERHARSREVQP